MASGRPVLPPYEASHATLDTVHAHTQVLGKPAVAASAHATPPPVA
jgi:hypothetical protein